MSLFSFSLILVYSIPVGHIPYNISLNLHNPLPTGTMQRSMPGTYASYIHSGLGPPACEHFIEPTPFICCVAAETPRPLWFFGLLQLKKLAISQTYF
ncbi:hypothetical protein BGX38DRAFT_1228519 [Terfezia claveryi]|nr:hypothetical protein BGX38DRAFT_1228519 [Terfezia claveryi]